LFIGKNIYILKLEKWFVSFEIDED